MAPSSSSAAATSVQVALRIRPPTNQDQSSIPARFQRSVIHATSSTSVSVDAGSGPNTAGPVPAASAASAAAAAKKQSFSFDRVHGPPTTQHEMFTTTALPLISRFVEGFNCTILAYGQTSSGKTHTMTGVDLDQDPSDPSNGMGIIPRAVSTIFSSAKQLREERAGAWTYQIKSSFIEIYNEDLIDLLVDDTAGGRREVQIREDKDGHIIWGGLREVAVKNPNEVMTLLRKGSSIRRTNETDMNAQSSRSHAIFSLTLTQRKFVGSGPPPRSSSPLPPNSRSPSRLARPGSMYAGGPGGAPASRVASPTGGRPATPSFASAMGRGGGLRPSSALGHTADRPSVDEDAGEWVTIVSKFHFVDLAGSERLKRTAAAGERVKEGISINSGLLALGNVISALGDPARAKSHMSHVPYRDSKLTRLLQDSLGGNAHTLMIACVSPAEWNVGETVNTLKYANRARNIKNSAVVNAREEGWEDVEWLQGTVRRLRVELKGLKEGGAIGASAAVEAPIEGAGKKVLAQMTELQNNYEDLREKFVERTEELTRLRRELGEKQRGSSGGAIGGTGKYEEIVGPVIEEYEKTIAAMEAELNLNRVALRHTNEMVEEKEDELALVTERHAATELYVEELRARVAKLTEREASTEAYVRDLEEKMKTYDETSITSSESMTDLKREVTRYRDTESHSAKYIADLEARLARTDESVLGLQQTVEKLEAECERRREEVGLLQGRLEALRADGDNWRSDLEERERKVRELEVKMQEWERKKKEAGDARVRLGTVVGEVAEARKSLQLDIGANGAETPPDESQTPLATVALVPDEADKHPDGPPPGAAPSNELQNQLVSLQQTHTATLADLSSVTAKYRDALREISDLAAQIQEAKLSGAAVEGPARADSPTLETPVEKLVESPPPFRRRMTGGARSRESSSGEPQYNSAGRRLFFRQAASAESLHGRSLSQSQSLSQELSSVHSRKTSFSSSTGSPHSSPLLSPYARPNLSISLPNSVPSPVMHPNERSVHSLEKEIMRLQEVLKDREAEIAVLEGSLKESKDTRVSQAASAVTPNGHAVPPFPPLKAQEPEQTVTPPASVNGDAAAANPVHLSPKTISQFDNIRRSMSHEAPPSVGTTTDEGSEVNGGSAYSEQDESLERLNELMLSMAQKESHHREVVEDLGSQLAQVRRQHDDLTALSRDQAVNMSAEIESLQIKHSDVLIELEAAKERENALVDSLEKAVAEHALEVEELQGQLDEAHKAHEDAKEQHEKELQQRASEATEALSQAQQHHENALSKAAADHAETLKQKEAQALATLQTTEEEYYNALTKLRADQASALETHASESAAALERLREEHAEEIRMAEMAREGSLSESQSSKDLAVQSLQEAHTAAVARKEASFVEELKDLKTEHARALTTKDEDYALEMDKLRSAHEGLVAKLKEEWRVEGEQLNNALAALKEESSIAAVKARADVDNAIQSQQEAQAALLRDVEQGHNQELAKLKSEHDAALQAALAKADEDHSALVESHMQETMLLKSQHQETIAEVNNSLVDLHSQHRAALEATRLRHQQSLVEERERLTATLDDLKLQHSKELETLHKDRDLLAHELESHKVAADEFTMLREQTRQAHEQAVGEKTTLIQSLEEKLSTVGAERAGLEAEVTQLRVELEKTRGEHSTAGSQRNEIEAQLATLRAELAETRGAHSSVGAERDEFKTQLASLREELDETRDAHSSAGAERDEFKAQLASLREELDETRDAHSSAGAERDDFEAEVARLRGELDQSRSAHSTAGSQRDGFEAEVAKLRAELDRTRNEQSKLIQEASKRESLVGELERHRSVLADMQENLQRVKDEKDTLQTEKNRSDSLVRELQAQVARSSSPPNVNGNVRGTPDRNMSYTRATGLPAMKLPPPTPPPSVPPPPAPRANGDSISSHASSGLASSSSRDSQLESPMTSVGPSSHNGLAIVDPKTTARLEAQAKLIDEQETMIKTLNKQLTHCESDLQTHMDLVSTLETSLGDSEKNLRKARMHATELARERDSLNVKIDSLRGELEESKREVVSVRNSVTQEKQTLEQRLDDERKAKERARQQLEVRMDELQKRKSKFACL
ncbi:kinesin domain-containing protein [Mycena alexandri]|uniref:Kinesin domain-containing protein n=1 Tax=Mycena alexandri TaxID=1745969 RepID=A0AAD6WX19_9AGAR|nr:kinesin domain-containing protein [Mycena alexandri]